LEGLEIRFVGVEIWKTHPYPSQEGNQNFEIEQYCQWPQDLSQDLSQKPEQSNGKSINMKSKVLPVVLALVTLGMGTGWLTLRGVFGPPVVAIINNSNQTLANPQLQGQDWSTQLSDLVAGETTNVVARIRGESDLTIVFEVGDDRYEHPGLAYLESQGGYCVTLEITETLEVNPIDPGIHCFRWARVFSNP
jgi:hypothetical protein